MFSRVSSRKARERWTDSYPENNWYRSWKKAEVIWLNTCHLALSHLVVKARGRILTLNFSASCHSRTPFPRQPPSEGWERRQPRTLLLWLMACLHGSAAAKVLSWLSSASGVTGNIVSWAEISEPLFLAMRWEIASAQPDFLITGWVCKA